MNKRQVYGAIAAAGAAYSIYHGVNVPGELETFEQDVINASVAVATDAGRDVGRDVVNKVLGKEDQTEEEMHPYVKGVRVVFGVDPPIRVFPEQTWRDMSQTGLGLIVGAFAFQAYRNQTKPSRRR